MTILLDDDERPNITIPQITTCHDQLGCNLPKEYKEFLMNHNGAFPEPSSFRIKNDDLLHSIDIMLYLDSNLFEPRADAFYQTISFTLEKEKDYIPAGSFVIAIVDRDDLLLLFYEGKRKGEIWLKIETYESPMKGENGYKREQGLCKVASSFTGFIEKLIPNEEDLDDD
ncbi:SMI1 / KNR4 family protein [Polystyrenella longa]|uniref:SMI1 / KNR4 family protein n=1 Tax=Polystyrenella longa TaxID=2528007 RepID=A0A518CKU5_9PLAN|nr:SMI1/KNR4 family protein [Polystyrenella longa]QDU79804.1 SMI1 / KNR4 family protein [Polystyrenella longa]